MSSTDFELDPERKLWKPSRRSFFFGLGAALVAPMLPSLPKSLESGWASGATSLRIGDTFTIEGVYAINPLVMRVNELFRVTEIHGATISISRGISPPLGRFANVIR